MGKYLDIARAARPEKYHASDPARSGVGDTGAHNEKGGHRRDKCDLSDRTSTRVRKGAAQHATLTVGEVAEEINAPKTGAAMQAGLYRRGLISKDNAVVWIAKAILVRRSLDTSGWRRHAPAVEALLDGPPNEEEHS